MIRTSAASVVSGMFLYDQYHWRTRGGVPPARAPPKGPDSFVLTYKIFRNVAASGVGAPLREILDPPLNTIVINEGISIQQITSLVMITLI